jgi:hypothetical protein
MNHKKRHKKAWGIDEYGYIDVPKRVSNIKISRIDNTDARGGCSYCFPHGFETNNNKWFKDLKCWKRYRKKQYRWV